MVTHGGHANDAAAPPNSMQLLPWNLRLQQNHYLPILRVLGELDGDSTRVPDMSLLCIRD